MVLEPAVIKKGIGHYIKTLKTTPARVVFLLGLI